MKTSGEDPFEQASIWAMAVEASSAQFAMADVAGFCVADVQRPSCGRNAD